MQLGTRWNIWQPAPTGLPDSVLAAVSTVEVELTTVAAANPEAGIELWRWTLTWLEGRPVVELEDGTIIRVDAQGIVAITVDTES